IKTSPQQRQALLQILSGKAGGVLFEILASIITTFYEPQLVPITFEFDKEKRKARLSVAGEAETVTTPLIIPATDQEQRVIVKMPNGFEYKEMEVAQTVTLKSTGRIKFEHRGTHSSLADVTYTHLGLIA
ncbi:MAG: DUF1326 domain-containing protein, partial [Burkholderiales bacterium]